MNIELNFQDKPEILGSVEKFIKASGLTITSKDFTRPWGGFFVLEESQATEFGRLFFPAVNVEELRISGKLSPKVLVVQPGKRLSWQYHHRRAEIWRVIGGSTSVVTSQTDEEGDSRTLKTGDTIRLTQGQRHRLVGLTEWGIVAEIWQHTVANHPSDEADIVRLQDDFGR